MRADQQQGYEREHAPSRDRARKHPITTSREERHRHENRGVGFEEDRREQNAGRNFPVVAHQPPGDHHPGSDQRHNLTEIDRVQHPPRRQGSDHGDPAADSRAHSRPRERGGEGCEREDRPDAEGDPVGQQGQGGDQPRHGRRADKGLRPLTRYEIFLRRGDQRLVVEMRPALVQPNRRRRKVGMKVDADLLMTLQQVERERDHDGAKAKPRPCSARIRHPVKVTQDS